MISSKPANPEQAFHAGKLLAEIDADIIAQQKSSANETGQQDANKLRAREADRRLADKYINGDGSPIAEEVKRLSGASAQDYELERKSTAKALGIRTSALDAFVAATRAGRTEALSPEPEPWTDPVVGVDLLEGITQAAKSHLVLPEGAAEVFALWVTFAHAHDCFDISPMLAISSPTPECGKTTCLTLLGGLAPRPLPASNITSAALFRAIEKWRPTLLIDEADTFLRDSNELRGILNSGHARANAFVIRTVGENHEPTRFCTWGAKAVALIGGLPSTLDGRSIHIKLRRMMFNERVAPLQLDRLDHLLPLNRKAARWASDNAKALRAADPIIPAHLNGRAADNWRCLLAIADVAGGRWPDLARGVAEKLGGRSEQTIGVMLLEDIYRILINRQVDRISSKELTEELVGLEHRPWPEFRGGKPLTQRQLAKLLDPFGVTPGTVRSGPDTTARGYRLEAFVDAFKRYLPPDIGPRFNTTTQQAKTCEFEPDCSDTREV